MIDILVGMTISYQRTMIKENLKNRFREKMWEVMSQLSC